MGRGDRHGSQASLSALEHRAGRLDGRVGIALAVSVGVAAAGGVIGDAAALAVFLRRVGSAQLPTYYVVSSLVAAGFGLLWVRRVASHPIFRVAPLAWSVTPLLLIGLAVAVRLDVRGSPWALSIIVRVLDIVQPLSLWGVAGAVVDAREARTLFPRLAGAAVGGTAIGGVATLGLVPLGGAAGLLVAWALLAIGVWALLRLVVRHHAEVSDDPDEGDSRREAGEEVRRFARWMSLAAGMQAGLGVFVEYAYCRAVEARFGTEAGTASFAGVMDGAVTLVSLAVSALLTPRLVRARGVMSGLLVMPAILVLGFLVLSVVPLFPVVVALSLLQRSTHAGATGPSYNAYLIVIPSAEREPVRAMLELVWLPVGGLLAGLVLTAGVDHLPSSAWHLGPAAIASLTIVAILAAQRDYRAAWQDALRQGLAHLLVPLRSSASRSIAVIDWTAEQRVAARRGLASDDETERRVSVGLLAEAPDPGDRSALLAALDDPSMGVRSAAVKALSPIADGPVLARLEPLLDAADPSLVVAVLEALEEGRAATSPRLEPLLRHPAPEVAIGAARVLLSASPHQGARRTLVELAAGHEDAARAALVAIASYPFAEAVTVCHAALAHLATREAACRALCSVDPASAPRALIALLPTSMRHHRAAIGACLSALGPDARDLLLAEASDPVRGGPALLVLAGWPGAVPVADLHALARARLERFHSLVTAEDGLADATDEAKPSAVMALLLASVREETESLAAEIVAGACAGADPLVAAQVLEAFDRRDRDHRVSALEVAESIGDRTLLAPVLAWTDDERQRATSPGLDATLRALERDPSPWLRDVCAALQPTPEAPVKTEATISTVERVVALRRVLLFRDVSISDLRVLAGLLGEELFADGATLGRQKEPGDRMYIVVSGQVSVCIEADDGTPPRQIALRGAGEHLGEMSLLDGHPRTATMIAVGATRTLTMTRSDFHRIATERPTIALAMARVLAERLRMATGSLRSLGAHEEERAAFAPHGER